ncbi:MAG: FliM/FliN family flagellar motor C-terminal domain-containing protein, partial [Myxococcota bacterium]
VEMPLPRNTPLLDVTLDFGPAEDPYGLVTLALPVSLAELIWPDATQRNEATERGVSRVLPLPVTVVAELARVKMSLSDLTALQEGSLVALGSPKSVGLSVSGRTALAAEAGVVDGTRCVRVLRRGGASAG